MVLNIYNELMMLKIITSQSQFVDDEMVPDTGIQPSEQMTVVHACTGKVLDYSPL